MTAAAVFPVAPPQAETLDYNSMVFLIEQRILKVETVTLVKVLSCTNSGGLTPSGTVDVQPLINQMTGNRTSMPHGKLSKMVYQRIQGGNNAIIMDPAQGDIGLAVFCSRDMSAVVSGKRQANPGSFRHHNFADGIYIGGVLNGTPQQYVRFTDSGIELVSPTEVTIQAPTITLDGDVNISGATVGTGEGTFNGIPVSTHLTTGVQSGTSESGPPVAP